MYKKTAIAILLVIPAVLSGLVLACAQAHASYEVLSLNVPANVVAGEKVIIRAEVKNVNSQTDTYNVPLMVDGVADSRESITLAPGQTEPVAFELTRSRAGTYKVSVGGKESTLTVEKVAPPDFRFSNMEISPTEVNVCETVVITVTLSNVGGNQGSYTAELKIDGITNQAQKLSVPAGTNCPLCFKVAKGLPGTYNVTLGNLSGQFVVKEPATPVFNIPVAPPCPPDTSGSCSPRG